MTELKAMSVPLLAMSGRATKEGLQKTLIALNEKKGADGKNLPYHNLGPRERAELDEAVDDLLELGPLFDAVAQAKAELTFKYRQALIAAGFNPTEAMHICATQDVIKQ